MGQEKVVNYLGFDIGSSSSKMCYVNRKGDKYSSPQIIPVSTKEYLPTITLLDKYGMIDAIGFRAYQEHSLLEPDEHKILLDIKTKALQKDPSAIRALDAIVAKFAQEAGLFFSEKELSSENFIFRVGQPQGINDDVVDIGNFIQEVNSSGMHVAGFEDELLAAINYYLFIGQMTLFAKEERRTLVFDFAGKNSRAAIFRQTTFGLTKEGDVTIEWGGDLIDEMMLNKWFIPKYCNECNLSFWQVQLLTQRMREFKEHLSTTIQNGGLEAKFDFHDFCDSKPEKIHRSTFEASGLAGDAITLLKEKLQLLHDNTVYSEADQIVLAGGSANWYFVRDIIKNIWPASRVIWEPKTEFVIVKGIALLVGGYSYKLIDDIPDSPSPDFDNKNNTPPVMPPTLPPSGILRKTRRERAEKLVLPYILWGTIIAALLAPIPGIAPVLLMAMEIWMSIQISKIYDQKLEGTTIVLAGAILIGLSIGLKTAVEFVLTVFYIMCFLKPLVAGIVIWLIGQAAIWFFDKVVYEGLESVW